VASRHVQSSVKKSAQFQEKGTHHLVYLSPDSFHTNTQTPVDSRQNGGRSPKQADFLDAPFLSCKAPQRGAPTLPGSDVGVPGGEARSQVFCGETGLWGQLECWGVKEPRRVTGPLCMGRHCLDLLPAELQKAGLPLELLGPSHCLTTTQTMRCRRSGPTGQLNIATVSWELKDPTYSLESYVWRFLAH